MKHESNNVNDRTTTEKKTCRQTIPRNGVHTKVRAYWRRSREQRVEQHLPQGLGAPGTGSVPAEAATDIRDRHKSRVGNQGRARGSLHRHQRAAFVAGNTAAEQKGTY